jgi:hypothetical protein
MTYNKPEVIKVMRAVEAVQTQNAKQHPNITDATSSLLPNQTSTAYEADE